MATTDKSEWILFDTDLTTQLAILPVGTSRIYFENNEPGAGELKIPLDSIAAGLISSGMFIQCLYRGSAQGGFFVDNINKFQASQEEGGGQWLQVTGRGPLALLEDAIIWTDGTTNTTRDFTSTQASILITLLTEAQARGGLSSLTWDFTALLDSASVSWDDSQQLSLTVGMNLLDLVRQFAKTGTDFSIDYSSGGFVLSAYKNGRGTDKAETVYFRVGTNCQEVQSNERGDKIENALLVAYLSGSLVITDPTSISNRRRRESLLDARGAQSSSSASTYGSAILENRKDPLKSISVKIYDGVSPRLFIDYSLGDYITLDTQGTETRYRILGIQADFSDDDFAQVIVELNSIFYEQALEMQQDLDFLLDQWQTAHDSNLIEVSFWAAIGDANMDYSSFTVLCIVGDGLYIVNAAVGGTRLNRYGLTTGIWEVLTGDMGSVGCADVVGTNIYFGSTNGVYKFDTTTDTLTTIALISYAASPALVGVYTIAVDGTFVYFAGAFDTIDGTAANGIIKYNTVADTWATLADQASFSLPVSSVGNYMLFHNGILYTTLQQWNGSVFSSNGKPGTIGSVYKMIGYGTDILIGTEDGLYIYDGVSWEVFGGAISGQVQDIAIYLTDIYIVGTFTDIGNRIARYSGGTWWELGTGLNSTASRIALVNDDVYVLGSFTTAGDKVANNIAAYFNNFESLVDYLENSSSSFNMGAAIHSAPASAVTDADEFPFWKDVSNALRKITWANIKATLKTYFDTLYVALTGAQTISGVKTFSSDPIIPDEAYDATNWNGSLEPPTKNAVRDKIESMGGGGGTPGGSDTQVQFNDGGAFGGESEFTWNKTTNALEIGGAVGSGNSRFQINDFGDSTTQPSYKGYKAGGTFGIPTAVLADYILMRYGAGGYDGVTPDLRTGSMTISANENFSGSAHGTRIDFFTTPDGSTVITKSFTIGADGNVNIGSGKTYNVNGSPHTHTGQNSYQTDQTGGTSDTYGVLAGLVNSSNKIYTVSLGAYVSGSLKVYLNGQLQTQGTGEDWVETTTSSGTFTFAVAPPTGSEITATYLFTTATTGNADTLDGLHSSAFQLVSTSTPNDGWIPISATGTSGTLDAPSFEISFNADMTGLIGLGYKIKITQTTTKYFIVTKVGAYSAGATVITCYGGTDYTLIASGTTAITNPYFSPVKAPFGFPVSPDKWTVETTDTSDRQQNASTINTWYNLGSVSTSVPIGVWNQYYKVLIQLMSAGVVSLQITLSTANNSESNSLYTSQFTATAQYGALAVSSQKVLTLTAKTTHYINMRNTSGTYDIRENNSAATLVSRFVCAYL